MSPHRGCPNPAELARMFSEGGGATPWSHVQTCSRCGERFRQFLQLREDARGLPTATPTAEHREQVRTELLSRARGARRARELRNRARRHLIGALGLSVAALAIAFSLRMRVANDAVYRAVAHGDASAQFVRRGAQPDEVVRLTEGTISLAVAPLHAGERFRVVVGDAEVEVRGTAFDVVARDDRLVAVHVRHGRVEVRPRHGALAVLGAGQAWQAPLPAPASAPDARPDTQVEALPIAAPEPTTADAPRDRPQATSLTRRFPKRPVLHPNRMTKADAAFERAWASMRAGQAQQAAAQLDEVLALHPEPGLEETASYWRGVALARAGRPADSARALRRFLAHHAASPRAGEASAMLGWMLLKAGDAAGAKQRFAVAVDDPVPEVRASARAGVAAADSALQSGSP